MAFQQAAISVLYRLTYLSATGLPPSWLGSLWTWPAAYRATRDCGSFVTRGSGKELFNALVREAYDELGKYTATVRERIAPHADAESE